MNASRTGSIRIERAAQTSGIDRFFAVAKDPHPKENHSGQRSDIDVIGSPQSNVVEESLLQRRWNRRLKRGRELLNACVGIRGTTNPSVRFNPDGMIDVRNGSRYAADIAVPYHVNRSPDEVPGRLRRSHGDRHDGASLLRIRSRGQWPRIASCQQLRIPDRAGSSGTNRQRRCVPRFVSWLGSVLERQGDAAAVPLLDRVQRLDRRRDLSGARPPVHRRGRRDPTRRQHRCDRRPVEPTTTHSALNSEVSRRSASSVRRSTSARSRRATSRSGRCESQGGDHEGDHQICSAQRTPSYTTIALDPGSRANQRAAGHSPVPGIAGLARILHEIARHAANAVVRPLTTLAYDLLAWWA